MRIIRIHRNSMPANLRVYVKHLLAIPLYEIILIPLFQLLKRSQKRYSQIFSFFNPYNRENVNFCTIIFVHIFVHLIFFILKLRNEKCEILMYLI